MTASSPNNLCHSFTLADLISWIKRWRWYMVLKAGDIFPSLISFMEFGGIEWQSLYWIISPESRGLSWVLRLSWYQINFQGSYSWCLDGKMAKGFQFRLCLLWLKRTKGSVFFLFTFKTSISFMWSLNQDHTHPMRSTRKLSCLWKRTASIRRARVHFLFCSDLLKI